MSRPRAAQACGAVLASCALGVELQNLRNTERLGSRLLRVFRSRGTRESSAHAELSLTEVAHARLGQVLCSKYRLDSVLGVGGMATVYAATHTNRRRFAIKLLHAELSISEVVRERFRREGYVTNSVDHPGAVAVLDDNVSEDGSAFLVMELLDGVSVEALWSKHGRSLSVHACLAIADQLLETLVAAHANGVLHRDLKPANLFVTRDGTVKLLDFGVARLQDAASGNVTQTGVRLGTPAYMAPEQAFGRATELDARADVWAVGATMFELLSGRSVFNTDDQHELFVALASRTPPPIRSVMPELIESVAQVIDKALSVDKQARWPSAKAMCEALRQAQPEACGSTLARGPSRLLAELLASAPAEPTLPSKRPSRTQLTWLLVALALLALWFALRSTN